LPGLQPCSSPLDRAASEEVAIQLAACILKLEGANEARGLQRPASSARGASRVIREIENDPAAPTDLASFARLARLSLRHFLRTFKSSRA
jgi:transcriptional regulator GlxA family with amidase domain